METTFSRTDTIKVVVGYGSLKVNTALSPYTLNSAEIPSILNLSERIMPASTFAASLEFSNEELGLSSSILTSSTKDTIGAKSPFDSVSKLGLFSLTNTGG